MNIPFLDFNGMHKSIREEMVKTFESVYDSNWFVLGKNVDEFEKNYANFSKTKYCIGLSNGLDALTLALRSLDIKKGDEVIVPSNTYIATVLSITNLGATPVFVEPCTNTYNLDPNKIEEKINEKTKAIMPVHLYGQSCDMKSIVDIASKHNLYVVEDNAQSQGSEFEGKLTGSWGIVNATSFYPGKNLGALGDAGAITTDDAEIAEQIRILRNYGSEKKYHNSLIGYNMRLDELQASFLNVKLNYLNQWTDERRMIAKWYDDFLSKVESIQIPYCLSSVKHVYHLYVIKTSKRDQLQSFLSKNGIGTLIHYPIPPHLQVAYKYLGYQVGDFPIAEELSNSLLSLPMWPGMTKDMVNEIAIYIERFFQHEG